MVLGIIVGLQFGLCTASASQDGTVATEQAIFNVIADIEALGLESSQTDIGLVLCIFNAVTQMVDEIEKCEEEEESTNEYLCWTLNILTMVQKILTCEDDYEDDDDDTDSGDNETS